MRSLKNFCYHSPTGSGIWQYEYYSAKGVKSEFDFFEPANNYYY